MLDELLSEAELLGVFVTEFPFKTKRLKALYTDGVITFNSSADFVEYEKLCALSEELGHHYTSAGNILDQSDIRKRKQELRARQWGYQRLIPLSSIVQAYGTGAKCRYEIADFLGVTEEFLQAAIDRYSEKYGVFTTMDNYIIFFEPLRVIEVLT
ncbi:ImmA/IrrE family metallo-endopeptidase [Paenibacillus senegalimassiliensis]|uniref:ImmA/IrrE family metallo-endopeptidase n=1 Tax=Paenibacillus senegalimassiliensis TaxID=1737426 RepID=UPI00073E4CAF|nr:ImmA/IrrE family metallo-endopeptidase [Paenibacillus senegalimassiliensis]